MAAAAAAATSSCWWYHRVSAAQAESLLLTRGHAGSFLLRPSSRGGGSVMSALHNGRVFHINICLQEETYQLQGVSEQFGSVSDLVSHCSSGHCILTLSGGHQVLLKKPLVADTGNLPDDPWFHRWLNGVEAEDKLQQHDEGMFLVRPATIVRHQNQQDNGILFALSVKRGDQVEHIPIRAEGDSVYVGGSLRYSSVDELVSFHVQNPLIDEANQPLLLLKPLFCTSFRASLINSRISFLARNGGEGFQEEFLNLTKFDDEFRSKPKAEGFAAINRRKNRFKNILPYDETRVVLRDVGTEELGDYVNANYLRPEIALPSTNTYIACQGPLESTVIDFWRMVWQENVTCIVMVTLEEEKGKKKCARYWPSSENRSLSVRAGPCSFSIKWQTEELKGDFVVTKLQVRSIEKRQTRQITHFQFVAWPDHSVPQHPESVIKLLQQVNDISSSSSSSSDLKPPIIIHCSAGIGRTGTFVLLDLLIHQVVHQGNNCEIDVFATTKYLRSMRPGMIQTESQYRFVFMAMLHCMRTVMGLDSVAEEVYST